MPTSQRANKEYVCEGNICRMLPANKHTDAMLIVSEKLDEFVEEWTPVPDNHALLVENDLSYKLISLD